MRAMAAGYASTKMCITMIKKQNKKTLHVAPKYSEISKIAFHKLKRRRVEMEFCSNDCQ